MPTLSAEAQETEEGNIFKPTQRMLATRASGPGNNNISTAFKAVDTNIQKATDTNSQKKSY